jgi:hypothetical protein
MAAGIELTGWTQCVVTSAILGPNGLRVSSGELDALTFPPTLLASFDRPAHPSGIQPHVIYTTSERIISQQGGTVRVAGFAFPALVKPRGLSPFPSSTDSTDWTWTDPSVPWLLNALHIQGLVTWLRCSRRLSLSRVTVSVRAPARRWDASSD